MNEKLKGLHLHFDPQSGIAGDMTVAALVNAGVPRAVVTSAIAAMGVPGLRVTFAPRRRGAFAGTAFIVRWPGMPIRPAHQDQPGPDQDRRRGHDDEDRHDHERADQRDQVRVRERNGDPPALRRGRAGARGRKHGQEGEHGREDADEHVHGHVHEDEHVHVHEDERGHEDEDEDEHGHVHEDEHGRVHEDEHGHAHEDEDGHGHGHGHRDEHGGGHTRQDEPERDRDAAATVSLRRRKRRAPLSTVAVSRRRAARPASASAGPGHPHAHRGYAEIQKLLRAADFPAPAKRLAAEIFARIAEAEAALHGVPLSKVAFHEVGAFDSIADVVGAAAALAWLAPSGVTATPPVLGTGSVRTAHGRVPVPAPATAALLRGVPVRSEGQGELTTPTGAAILATVVGEFRDLPPVRLRAQGFGAGTRELADRPNVLRVILGEPIGQALPPSLPEVTLLQANVDDMNPQLVEPLMTALFAAGALDVWVTSILMKKGRPALEVSALAGVNQVPALARAFFAHSTTLGVRQSRMERTVLSRSAATVETRFGKVPIKVAALDGQVLSAAPEFDDCRRLAARAGVPVREVIAEAASAANHLTRPPRALDAPHRPRRGRP
jgi:uncharacterized protein (TIGR00299 family) protein